MSANILPTIIALLVYPPVFILLYVIIDKLFNDNQGWGDYE